MGKRARDYETMLVERLCDSEYAVDYLNAILAEGIGDTGAFLAGLRRVAKARGIGLTRLSEDAGLGRQALYRSLSTDGNPELTTLTRVLSELGLRLAVRSAA